MKILLSTGLTYKVFTTRQTENLAIELGYDGLEYIVQPLRLLSKHPNKEDQSTWQQAHTVKVVHAPFSLPAFKSYSRSIEIAVQVAQKIKACTVNVHPHALHWFFGGKKAQAHAARVIREVQEVKGLNITVEVLPRPRGNARKRFKTWLQQPFRHPDDWVKYIISNNLNACLDTTHLGTWDIDPTHCLKQLGQHVAHVHLSDYRQSIDTEHVVPGEGDLDLRQFLQTLNKYTSPPTVTVELSSADTPEDARQAAARSIAFIRHALG